MKNLILTVKTPEGAKIRVFAVTNPGDEKLEKETEVFSVSEENGETRFDLAPGRYVIRQEKAGFYSAERCLDLTEDTTLSLPLEKRSVPLSSAPSAGRGVRLRGAGVPLPLRNGRPSPDGEHGTACQCPCIRRSRYHPQLPRPYGWGAAGGGCRAGRLPPHPHPRPHDRRIRGGLRGILLRSNSSSGLFRQLSEI